MARVIGYVKSFEAGTFFVKDAKGHVHQLKAGEAIHEGEVVYGAHDNPDTAQIIIDVTLQGAGDLVIAGNGALTFDTSLLKGIFSHDDAVVYVNSLKDALALAGGNITNVDTDLKNGDLTHAGEEHGKENETAAGKALSDQEHASDTFTNRDGLAQNVTTVLNYNPISNPEAIFQQETFLSVVVNNDPTVVVNDVTSTNEDTAVVIDVLANDTDIDSAKSPVASVTNGAHGTVSINVDGTVTYTPEANYNGTDSFTYTNAEGNTATVNVTINPVNDAPTSINDVITILEDMNNTMAVYTLAVSDFGTYNDIENSSLNSIRIDSLPTNGALYLNGVAVAAGAVVSANDISSGKLTFNPIDNTDVDSSFKFSVNDGIAWSASSYTTTVTIDAVADTPTAIISGTGAVTQTITISNVSSATLAADGFSVQALNPNGSASTISINSSPAGFGVTGATTDGDAKELGYLNGTGSEKLVVTLNNTVSSVDVSFAWKHSYGAGETARVYFYNGSTLIGYKDFNGGSDSVDPAITLQPNEGGVFNKIEFTAMGTTDDYLIHSISFDKINTSPTTITTDDNRSVDLDASSALVDTDGSEILSTTISGLPVGYALTDGTHTFTATSGSTVANVTGWDLANLSLNVPTVTTQTTVTLTITATVTETSNSSTASVSDAIEIIVVPYSGIPVLNDNVADVYESAMLSGTNSSSNTEVVTGNIFTNDRLPVGVTLTNVSIVGGTTDTSVIGQITVNTAEGNTLVVDKTTGTYTYTLNNAVNHSQIVATGNTITLTTVGGEVANNTFTGTSKDGWIQSTLVANNSDRLVIDGNGDTASKTFDFGSLYANKIVSVAFNYTNSGNWESAETLNVSINGATPISYARTATGDQIINNVMLDATGKVSFVFTTGTDSNQEDTYIDNFIIRGPEYTTQLLDTVVDSFTYTVTDTNNVSYNAKLDVTIHDDSPVVNDTTSISISLPPETDTNILLTLDVSGSMNDNVNGISRLNIAKAALIDTINAYDGQGSANVNLTLFNTQAVNVGWMTAAQAIDYISKLSMNNMTIQYNGANITGLTDVYTNYEAAIAVTPTTYNINLPLADKTVAYFISDGAPTKEYNDNTTNATDVTNANSQDGVGMGYLDSKYVTEWDNFITNNNIDLTVIGIGSSLNMSYLNMVQVQDGETAIEVQDETTLSETITSRIESVSGSLYGSDGQAGINFGADGGHVLKITYGTTTYMYDQSNPTQDIVLNEGRMALNFETGQFTYTPTSTSGIDITENFIISVTDADGDSTIDKSLNLVIGIDDNLTFTGTAIDGHAGIDTLILQTNANIDFSALANDVIKNMEVIDLTQNGDHNLTKLSYADVIDMTDGNNTLKIIGDNTSDKVELTEVDGWTKQASTVTEAGHTFDVYTSHGINATDPTVTVKVETVITDTVV